MKKLRKKGAELLRKGDLTPCRNCRKYREKKPPFHSESLYPPGWDKCFCAYAEEHMGEPWAREHRRMAGWKKGEGALGA